MFVATQNARKDIGGSIEEVEDKSGEPRRLPAGHSIIAVALIEWSKPGDLGGLPVRTGTAEQRHRRRFGEWAARTRKNRGVVSPAARVSVDTFGLGVLWTQGDAAQGYFSWLNCMC